MHANTGLHGAAAHVCFVLSAASVPLDHRSRSPRGYVHGSQGVLRPPIASPSIFMVSRLVAAAAAEILLPYVMFFVDLESWTTHASPLAI